VHPAKKHASTEAYHYRRHPESWLDTDKAWFHETVTNRRFSFVNSTPWWWTYPLSRQISGTGVLQPYDFQAVNKQLPTTGEESAEALWSEAFRRRHHLGFKRKIHRPRKAVCV